MSYKIQPIPRWRQERVPDLSAPDYYRPIDRFLRAREGRERIWEAAVELRGGEWWGTVYRWEGGARTCLRLAFGLGGDQAATASGLWNLGPFTEPEVAIRFTERWLTMRRQAETWDRPHPFFPPGDRYTLRIRDAEPARRWAEGADLILVSSRLPVLVSL
jgi:hypothetical protein